MSTACRGGWELIDSHGAGTVVCPFTTGRGIGTETCEMDNVFPLVWLGHLWQFVRVYIYIYNCVFGSLISDVTCNYVSAEGGRDGLWWPALPGHWLSYTGCWLSLLIMYWLLCLGCCFYFNHLPRMFLSTDFAFRITNWTCCHGPHLHAILRIISRGVSGLATDSPCGVWSRGWTTCLLHDSPLFGSHFKMRVGM